jgi:diguanylate cyclase (GGDEF)-like protein
MDSHPLSSVITAHLPPSPTVKSFIQRLLVPVDPVSPSTPCEEVYHLFSRDKSLQSVAVVHQDEPMGLVNRYGLIDQFSRRFFREIYERKPISNIMEHFPLVIEASVSLDDLSAIIADEEEKYLYEGFIITQDGKYLGIGTGHRLMKEMTARKQAQLYHLAHHDTLTGLPNRLLFYDRLRQSLHNAQRSNLFLAVLFLDLDHFKKVNDTYGHPQGDALLQIVAQRLNKSLREGDTVARLGGDEFTVILTHVSKQTDVDLVVRKIFDNISEPIQLDGHELKITCSIGSSLYPADGTNMEGLIQKADTAVYHAKLERNTFKAFQPFMTLVGVS